MCSNPTVQIAAIEAGALQQLIRLLSVESSVTFRTRLLAALSSLIRHFPFAQRKFLELGGLQTLSSLLSQQQTYDTEKLSVKAITLISDLLTERVCIATLQLVNNSRKISNTSLRLLLLDYVVQMAVFIFG